MNPHLVLQATEDLRSDSPADIRWLLLNVALGTAFLP